MTKYWGLSAPRGDDIAYARIVNPLSSFDYGNLVDAFVRSDFARRIRMKVDDEWQTTKAGRLVDAAVRRELVEEMGRLDDKFHFNMLFSRGRKQLEMEFNLHEGQAVGYRIFGHQKLVSQMFECPNFDKYERVSALWAP